MKIRYFAWVRQRIGAPEEEIDLPGGIDTVEALAAWLKTRSAGHEAAFADMSAIRAARDHAHVSLDTPIGDAREIAFFPPVTGG